MSWKDPPILGLARGTVGSSSPPMTSTNLPTLPGLLAKSFWYCPNTACIMAWLCRLWRPGYGRCLFPPRLGPLCPPQSCLVSTPPVPGPFGLSCLAALGADGNALGLGEPSKPALGVHGLGHYSGTNHPSLMAWLTNMDWFSCSSWAVNLNRVDCGGHGVGGW